jgi:hypothetical protein
MSKPYPVVLQRPLTEPPKRGLFGLAARRRSADELPAMAPHEVRVFRVDDQYVLDTGRRRLDDDQLVHANHVSVVDLSRNVLVTVRLTIPSCEATDFTVDVTFSCSVTDARRVVMDGQDAEHALLAYLRRHMRFFELGLDHRIKDIATVRRNVNAQVMAYTAERPPQIPGLAVAYASVEVLEPEELIGFEKQRRDQDRSTVLATERLTQNHTVDFTRQQQDQILRTHQQQYEHDRDVTNQAHEQMLDAAARDHALQQTQRAAQAIGDDPDAAAYWTEARGQMSAREVQELLAAAEERRQRDRRDELALQREDRLRREDRAWEMKQDRIQVRRQRHRELEERIRADRQEQVSIERELGQARRESDRSDRNWQQSVVQDLIRRGHGDQLPIDVEKLVTGLGSDRTAIGEREAAGEIEAPKAERVEAEPVEAEPVEPEPADRPTRYDAAGEDDDDY